MDIIDAFWEKRNLNLNTVEVILDKDDNIDKVLLSELEKKYGYIVFKVPTGQTNQSQFLTDNGFSFIESQLSLSKKVAAMPYDDRLVKYTLKNISTHRLETIEQVNELLKLMTPNMFSTDRIALDLNFGLEVGLCRYRNWIIDEFNRGSIVIYIMMNKGPIGFSVFKIQDGILYGYLGGIFERFQSLGYGMATPLGVYSYLQENPQYNVKLIKTSVSSNNFPVIQFYNHLNYTITDIKYIFTKSAVAE